MKKFTPISTEIVSAITCDCCQRCFTKNDTDWYEIQSIEFVAGYSSIFGDGNSVSIDLCQECFKQNLGAWLRIDTEPRWEIDDNGLLKNLGKVLQKRIGNIHMSIDDALKVAVHFAAPPAGSIQPESEKRKNLTPPQGYQSWLHYAVETMDTRNLEIEGILDEWPNRAGKAVSRDEMRMAAQRELRQILDGSSLENEPPTELIATKSRNEPIENLKGVLHKPGVTVSINDMGAADGAVSQGSIPEWDIGLPAGCEFGAESQRFSRALRLAISVFGNPLAAVQWLISFNTAVGDEPMKSVLASEERCKYVMAVLSA